jgi:hypothetical protein
LKFQRNRIVFNNKGWIKRSFDQIVIQRRNRKFYQPEADMRLFYNVVVNEMNRSATMEQSTLSAGTGKIIIIFLDIDGVLLPFPNAGRPSSVGGLFPDRTLEALSNILKALPETKVVLSSTWRVYDSACRDIIDSFRQYGTAYGGPLADMNDFYDITNPTMHTERQHEIYAWLQQKQQQVPNQQDSSIAAWIALDDEEMMEGTANAKYRSIFQGHVVQTKSYVGLTLPQAEMAIQLIQNQLTTTGNRI